MTAERIESQLPTKESERSELQKLAGRSTMRYIKEVLPGLNKTVKNWEGRVVVGGVEGRPDDEEIEIDRYGEEIMKADIKAYKTPIRVYNEHSYFGPIKGALWARAADTFDNSTQYKRRLPTSVFTCTSDYDLEGNPLAGSVTNIRDASAIVALQDHVFEWDGLLDGSGFPRLAKKSEKTSIKDPGITIASYTGSKEYAVNFYSNFDEEERRFNINFGKMINDMDRKGRTYADGGAFIYGLLANGSVDAYVMRDEPISEIAAGAAVAQIAGCTLWCVDEKGNIEDYRFDPRKFRENVPVFIAAGTPELAREVYDYYFKYKDTEGDVRIPFALLARLD